MIDTEEIKLLVRLADYVRLRIGTGSIDEKSPVGVAYGDLRDWRKKLAASEASEGAKPPTREGGGVRVERFDGLHASEASGPASAIKGGGAGKATEPGAAGEALRDENSQLPDGLPSLGGGESERVLLAAIEKEVFEGMSLAELELPVEILAGNKCKEYYWRGECNAYFRIQRLLAANKTPSVKPIAGGQRSGDSRYAEPPCSTIGGRP